MADAMDKSDLSLILSALSVVLALGAGPLAAALIAAYVAGLLTARATRGGP